MLPSGEVARQVTGLVEARTRRVENGSSMKRSAVSSGRLRYPRPTWMPPMYSSPAVPIGTELERLVEDVHLGIGDGLPDRNE